MSRNWRRMFHPTPEELLADRRERHYLGLTVLDETLARHREETGDTLRAISSYGMAARSSLQRRDLLKTAEMMAQGERLIETYPTDCRGSLSTILLDIVNH